MRACKHRRSRIGVTLAATLLCSATTEPRGQQRPEPLRPGKTERVDVRLVILDAVAIDPQGRTVPDLGRQEIEVVVDGKRVGVDTLDIDCPIGVVPDPDAVRSPANRDRPIATETPRRVVFAFDYLHLSPSQRVIVLQSVADMIEHGTAEGDEIMLAALTGGLRVEQEMTADRDEVLASLHRMQYDISLWQPDFHHLNEFGFLDGLELLFDVLGTIEGTKAVVFFSAIQDVPLDTQFERIAASAAASRSAIYGVDVRGLLAINGQDARKVTEQDLRREAKERMGKTRSDMPSGTARAPSPG